MMVCPPIIPVLSSGSNVSRRVRSATSTATISPYPSSTAVNLLFSGEARVINPEMASTDEIVATVASLGSYPSGVKRSSAPAAQQAAAVVSVSSICVRSALRDWSLVHVGQPSSIALMSRRP